MLTFINQPSKDTVREILENVAKTHGFLVYEADGSLYRGDGLCGHAYASAVNFWKHDRPDIFEAILDTIEELGQDLGYRICGHCGEAYVDGFYFPTFSVEGHHIEEYVCEECFEKYPQEVKDAWDEYYDSEGDDCWTQWD